MVRTLAGRMGWIAAAVLAAVRRGWEVYGIRRGSGEYRTVSKVTELARVAPAALPTIPVDLSGVFSR